MTPSGVFFTVPEGRQHVAPETSPEKSCGKGFEPRRGDSRLALLPPFRGFCTFFNTIPEAYVCIGKRLKPSLQLVLLVWMLCLPIHADSAITSAGKQFGTLSLKAGVLLIDRKPINWSNMHVIRRDIRQRFTAPDFLHLRNGETWAGRVLGIKKSKLIIFVEPLGQREIDMQLIAAISFRAGHRFTKHKPGRAYRLSGKPISGELVAINAKQIQLKTALGRFNFVREELTGYVLADAAKEGTKDHMNVGLVNGSLFFGEASLKGNKIVLKHSILGNVELNLKAIQYLLKKRESNESRETTNEEPQT